jgi:hypothetical protein
MLIASLMYKGDLLTNSLGQERRIAFVVAKARDLQEQIALVCINVQHIDKGKAVAWKLRFRHS